MLNLFDLLKIAQNFQLSQDWQCHLKNKCYLEYFPFYPSLGQFWTSLCHKASRICPQLFFPSNKSIIFSTLQGSANLFRFTPTKDLEHSLCEICYALFRTSSSPSNQICWVMLHSLYLLSITSWVLPPSLIFSPFLTNLPRLASMSTLLDQPFLRNRQIKISPQNQINNLPSTPTVTVA